MEDGYFEGDGYEPTDIEAVETALIDEGFDPMEVEELLYDPAPRRRKARRKTTAARTSTRRYKAKAAVKKGRKKAKGALTKLKKFALPGAAGVTFYAGYMKRADELFTAGLITKKSVVDAIQYDIKNFDTDAAMDRLKDNAAGIITPAVGGTIIKETKILGKYSGLAKDLLVGMAAGKAAKVILDPPVPGATPQQPAIQSRSSRQPAKQVIDMHQTAPGTWEV